MSARSLLRLLPVAMTLVLLGSGAALAVTPLGPVYPLPGGPGTGHGGSTCLADTDNEAAMGKTAAANLTPTAGVTWHYGGGSDPAQTGPGCPFSATPTALPVFDTTRFERLFWGMSSAPTLALDGLVDNAGGTAETLVLDAAASDPATGLLVWTGSTRMTWCQPASCVFQTTPVNTRFELRATKLDGTPVPLVDPTTVDVADPVGGLVEVTPALPNFKVNLVMLAQHPTAGTFQPAISMYNSLNHPNPPVVSPQTQMGFGGGFRYLSRAPQGSITGSDPLNHQPTTFTADATDPDGTIAAYAWDLDNDGEYDDGNESTATTPAYGPGTHTVFALVTDDDGTQTVLTRDFTIVNQPPVASLSCVPNPVAAGDDVTCTSDSVDPDGAPGDPALQHEWIVDGASVPGGEQITLNFADAGDHDITLLVADRDGAAMPGFEVVTVLDVVPPAASLALARQKLGAILKSGIKGTLTVDEASTATLKATISKTLARRLKIKPVVGTGAATVPSAGDVPVTVKLTRAAKRKLKTLGKVAIKVTAAVTDDSGNRTTTTASRTYQK